MNGDFDNKLSVYLRSERAMLHIFVRNKLRQLLFVSLSFIALLTALILFDLAVFFTLQTHFPTNITAFILASSHAFLFFILLMFAKQKKHQQEVEALRDIRDFAREQVSRDVKTASDEVIHMGTSVKQVIHHVSSFFNGEIFSLTNLVPILHSLLKNNK